MALLLFGIGPGGLIDFSEKMTGVSEEIKAVFKENDVLIRLILFNTIVFVAVQVIYVILWLFQIGNTVGFQGIPVPLHWYWLGAPADLGNLIFKPWTVITYMFVHASFWHLFMNMLVLFFSGRIFREYLGTSRMLSTYIYGGVVGYVLYMLAYNFFPIFSQGVSEAILVGASAGVVAVLIAVTAYTPNFTVRLFFTGFEVKLKYLAAFLIVLDIISIKSSNPGGHIAHLGGALYGFYFARQYRKGVDHSRAFNSFVKRVTGYFMKSRTHLNVSHSARRNYKSDEEYNYEKKANQQQMDEILDKISKSGYESLSKEEKAVLFKFGKKD